ncbi:hypothetical protein [Salinisphaera sp. G21_0]|uniref:hypothetical protein n=1 Tax=Salinisphaera sp. G21_0 TaxID=2821094 RepID=UPI001ADBB11A|nr:hypothetical protein [Salinisphaera sp. G21_0]MBO9484335.1 hypothetical protein [Salinisphaera sp. G21_0]
MNFKEFWNGLTRKEQVKFAKSVGFSIDVCRNEYLSPNPQRRPMPSKAKLARMVIHGKRKLKVKSLMEYFGGEGVEQMVAEQKRKSPVSGA